MLFSFQYSGDYKGPVFLPGLVAIEGVNKSFWDLPGSTPHKSYVAISTCALEVKGAPPLLGNQDRCARFMAVMRHNTQNFNISGAWTLWIWLEVAVISIFQSFDPFRL